MRHSNPTQPATPLILFSGMGADASVFLPQKKAFPHLIVPEWPIPKPDDDLSSYCRRLAADVDPDCPCFVGGASFGGIVALEFARYLDAKACFLIGSIRSPKQLPLRIRMFRSLGFGIGLLPIRLLQKSAARLAKSARHLVGNHVAGIMRQFSASDVKLLRWSARQVLRWKSVNVDIPVFHIHGQHDRIFPVRLSDPDEIIPDGGHVISLTHGEVVNEFLRKHMAQFDVSTT